ncbi:hypothetical protein Hdeb2414_s0012g00391421 [Helianthus debilis subsp. tardiflorus]
MKISSRSILSPGRATYSREPPPPPPIALSTSLSRSRSRRLSNSRSIKGGASPAMFPVTGKKRGCGFDNPEPSSPKVTCIGQVRVKTKKKHGKNVRRRKLEHSRSQRQHFKCLHNSNSNNNNNNNQRWVHIPLTICETLRTFGSEVSCLFPCGSSTEKMEEERQHGSCSAVVERWLVTLQDEEEVGNTRRHVFDDLEIVNDVILGSKDEEASRSVCVPPKNALLLMRCRSDPVKMEALTTRFWEPTLETYEEKDEDLKLENEKLMVLDETNDQEHQEGEGTEETKHQEGEGTEETNDQEHQESEGTEETKHQEGEGTEETNDQEHQEGEGAEETNDQEHQEGEGTEETKHQEGEGTEETNLEMGMEQSIQEEDDDQDKEQNMETDDSFFLRNLFEDQVIEEEKEEDFDMVDAQEKFFETGDSYIEKVKQFQGECEEMLTEFIERSQVPEGEAYEEIETGEQFEEEIEGMLTEFSERSEIPEEINEEVETGESNIEKVKQFEEGNEQMLTEISKIPEEINEEIETGESNIEKVKQFEEGDEQLLTERSEVPEEESFVQETKTGESKTDKVKQFEVQGAETGESNIEKVKQAEEKFEEMLTEFTEEIEVENEEREKIEALPECLLLMMYEPTEVSKETWVRSSDFTPSQSSKKKPVESNVNQVTTTAVVPVAHQPARSLSCSFPVQRSMITVLEEKLVNTMGFEPLLALTRCKSEPTRMVPESCSWQNQLEPPRRASFGVGMAGLGLCQFRS